MFSYRLSQRLAILAPFLLPILLDSALKGLAILLLTALAVLAMRRSSAAARHLVWFLGTSSLLILPILSAALPSWHILPRWLDNLAASAPISAPAPALLPTVPEAQIPPNAPDWIPPTNAPLLLPPPQPTAMHLHWQAWTLLAWATGCILVLAYLYLGYLSLWRLRRQSTPLTSHTWLIALDQARDELNLRRPVQLLTSLHRTMPMTWGLWRTRLLLPAESSAWNDQQRRAVFLHELAHAKRWDCLTQLIAQLVCAIYWFNPLVWFAWKHMQDERERACDDLVLSAGTKASAYAEQLLHIASEMPVAAYSAAAIAMARPSSLEGRLLAILDVTRNRRRLSLSTCAITTLLIAALTIPLAMVRAAAPPKSHIIDPNDNSGNAAAQADLAKSVKHIQLKAVGFSDVIDYLRDSYPANIIVNWDAVKTTAIAKTTPVTISLQNIKLATALENVLQNVSNGKLDYAIYQGVILITTPQEIQNLQQTPPHKLRIIGQPNTAENRTLISILEKVPAGEAWSEAPFTNIIDFLRDTTGANIVVDWDSAKSAGVDPTVKLPQVNLNDVKFSNLLTLLLSQQLPGKLDYAIFDGTLWISTPAQLDKLAKTTVAIPGHPSPKLRDALDRIIPQGQPDGVPLRDWTGFLPDITGTKMEVRWEKLQQVGVTPTQTIHLSLRNIRYSSALELLLLQPGLGKLAYTTDGDTIIISTPADLNAATPPGATAPTSPYAQRLAYLRGFGERNAFRFRSRKNRERKRMF